MASTQHISKSISIAKSNPGKPVNTLHLAMLHRSVNTVHIQPTLRLDSPLLGTHQVELKVAPHMHHNTPFPAKDRVGRRNLSILLPSTARENGKLMTNGRLTVPIARMALPLATPVAFLNELGNPGIA